MNLSDEKERILKEHGSNSEEYRFFCECMMLVKMKYKARHDYLDGVEKHRGEYHRNDNERRKS